MKFSFLPLTKLFLNQFYQFISNHFLPNCFFIIFTQFLFTAASSCKTKFYLLFLTILELISSIVVLF